MNFRFGKPLEFRLSQLETNVSRIPVSELKDLYLRAFSELTPFHERLLVGNYDAAFQHTNNNDVVYSFRNEDEIAFAGYFPSSGGFDTLVLGLSANSQDPRYDTHTLAHPHKSVNALVHYPRRGVVFVEKEAGKKRPNLELYSPGMRDLSALQDDLRPFLTRFDNLLYTPEVPEPKEFKLEKHC